MEFIYEEKKTPTYKEYAKSSRFIAASKHEIIRIFCNADWRTITFITEEFKINRKFSSSKEFDSEHKKLRAIVTKYCRSNIEVHSPSQASVRLFVASDSDDSPAIFEADDYGFIRSNQ